MGTSVDPNEQAGKPAPKPDYRRAGSRGTCTVGDCERQHYAHGYCMAHYKRWKRWGDPLGGEPFRLRRPAEKKCTIEGCTRKHQARGYCDKHYQRWYHHDDPNQAAWETTGEFRPGRGGYRTRSVLIDGKRVLQSEHRVVMEGLLGRPLFAHENVHHINGDRSDNRPENLELWTTSQPSGQRVEDKVAWAVEIVRQYRPHLLVGDDEDLTLS